MVTFADLSTLLLTFFILLLSFAEMDIVKFRDALGSIQLSLGFTPSRTGMFKNTTNSANFEKPMALPSFKATNSSIISELQELVDRNELRKDVELENADRGVIMRIRGRLFFYSGTADLMPESEPILKKIADMLRKFPRKIAIEGHTDNIPIKNGKFSSNWELSTARAYAALKYLQKHENINVDRIHIAGYADTHPIASNDTLEGREKNRRVEFVFYEK